MPYRSTGSPRSVGERCCSCGRARIDGDHALKHLGRAKAEFKQQNHIVTDLDRQCQQLIIDHIRTHHPGHGFIGEESQTSSFLKNPPAPDNDI
ncbi:MAG: hypothetical protein IH899_14550 [Planctomycetes bacterium]|nr:hypothetical protein [Planctomycetota bacterium]